MVGNKGPPPLSERGVNNKAMPPGRDRSTPFTAHEDQFSSVQSSGQTRAMDTARRQALYSEMSRTGPSEEDTPLGYRRGAGYYPVPFTQALPLALS